MKKHVVSTCEQKGGTEGWGEGGRERKGGGGREGGNGGGGEGGRERGNGGVGDGRKDGGKEGGRVNERRDIGWQLWVKVAIEILDMR